jgi:hypothetical protein
MPSFSGPERTVTTRYFQVHTDMGDRLDSVLPRLDDCLEDMCARWELAPPIGDERWPLVVFRTREDFQDYSQDHDVGDGARFPCAGFYCGRLGTIFVPYSEAQRAETDPVSELVLDAVLADRRTDLSSVLAHEAHHQLLWLRLPGLARRLPAWLVEGLARLEGERQRAELDGGYSAPLGLGPSAAHRTTALLNLTAWSTAGARIFDDSGVEVTWTRDRYDLHYALCLALLELDPRLFNRWLRDGAPPPIPSEAAIRRQVTLLAADALKRSLRPGLFMGQDYDATSEIMSLAWGVPVPADAGLESWLEGLPPRELPLAAPVADADHKRRARLYASLKLIWRRLLEGRASEMSKIWLADLPPLAPCGVVRLDSEPCLAEVLAYPSGAASRPSGWRRRDPAVDPAIEDHREQALRDASREWRPPQRPLARTETGASG